MYYDTRNPYDPLPDETPEALARMQQRIERSRQAIRDILPRLRELIEDPKRDPEDVYQALRPYHLQVREVPMTPADTPELEALCRLVLEKGGLEQNNIQRVLLSLVAATAARESTAFLVEMFHYSRRGDHFGPERRQLALWGLARIAIAHNVPEAYAALREGMDDRRAEVRYTAADLILNAYLDARREVPSAVVARLREMAEMDSDKDVRRAAWRYLREPWAKKQQEGGKHD